VKTSESEYLSSSSVTDLVSSSFVMFN